MKTKKLKVAASIIIMAALVVCGFTLGNAYALQSGGNALLYTYYDVRTAADGGLGLTDNYFTVTNTSTDWVQAHVRVRTGSKSVELLDFDVLLSPKDVFAFDLYESAGGINFASCDTDTLVNSGFAPNYNNGKCVVLNSGTNPNMLSLIETCTGETAEEALADTLKGYVEVIGEGAIVPKPTDETECASAAQTIPGFTLYDLSTACAPDILPLSVKNISDPSLGTALEGRVYYITVDNDRVVQRLAYLNAETLDSGHGLIMHADTYQGELARCATHPADGCFAYAAASTSPDPDGANDMNYCFYTATMAVNNVIQPVFNRFGAAATFGPTIADLYNNGPTPTTGRTGLLGQTAISLNGLSYLFSFVNIPINMYSGYPAGQKAYADSHYFNVPAPDNSLDMTTKFAFIFPFQHFIKESDVISIAELYDTEENFVSTPTNKFISPGLPTVTTPGEEASLFSLTSSAFSEGWVSFGVTASNATCSDDGGPGGTIIDNVRCSSPTDSYIPGYTGAVITTGAHSIGASLFDYRGPLFIAN